MTASIPPLAGTSGAVARPFWSVMIPTYEPSERLLSETLSSVLNRRESREMQVEVVDDASPSVDVATLVRRIAGERVTVYRNRDNIGLAGTWNRCIARGRGEWVHILHHDDVIDARFYVTLERLIDGDRNAGAAFCRHRHVDAEGRSVGVPVELQNHSGRLVGGVRQLAVRNQIQCPSVVVRRSVYEEIGGFDPSYKFVLDWELWVRIASRFPVLYECEPLASFRIAADSETSRLARDGTTAFDAARFIANYDRYLPVGDVSKAQREALEWISELAFDKAGRFLRDGDVEAAMNQARAAVVVDPRRRNWRRAAGVWLSSIRARRRWVRPPWPLSSSSRNSVRQ